MEAAEVKKMDRALDLIYRETDRDFQELRPSDEEWQWARTELKPFTDRIAEIEETLVYSLGRTAFAELLDKWQKNIRHVLKMIKKRRTEPFA